MIRIEDSRGIAFRGGNWTGMVQQLAQFFHRVTDVGPQHVFTKELVKHLTYGTLQERDTARVSGAMPRVRTVVGVFNQCPEERGRQAVDVCLRFANDMPGDELGRILEHVNKAMQFPQNVIGNVARRPRFAVQIDRNFGVLEADFTDEFSQLLDRRVDFLTWSEFFVVDRQNESGRTTLLLGKLRQVPIARDPQDFHPLLLNRIRESANSQP